MTTIRLSESEVADAIFLYLREKRNVEASSVSFQIEMTTDPGWDRTYSYPSLKGALVETPG